MFPGHNTNGFPHHRLEDTIRILADLGFKSVAITLDHHALDPQSTTILKDTDRIGQLTNRLGLRVVIETGARFLLDPWRKHQPTLLDPDPEARAVRSGFLKNAIRIGAELNADAISFWSGTLPEGLNEDDISPSAQMDRLVQECQSLADHAARLNQRLAFEPEPGMFIDTMARFEQLFRRVNHGSFGLTIDLGHLHCLDELPMTPHLIHWQKSIWNIHVEGMRKGIHEHLQLDEGDMDLHEALCGLKKAGYAGGLHLEMSRHGHDAIKAARRGLEILRAALENCDIAPN